MVMQNMNKGKDFIGIGVGAVILNPQNEILLLERNKSPEHGYWSIPGGSVEFGETIEDAIVREVKEELGLEVRIIKMLRVTNHILKEKKIHWVSPAFLVKIISGEPQNKENTKHNEIRWFPIFHLPPNITITTKLALESYINSSMENDNS